MSRNLCSTECRVCGAELRPSEPPRPPTAEDCGRFVQHMSGYLVAKADCRDCGAKFLAWMHSPRGGYANDHGVTDSSWRHSFNDEPSRKDAPDECVIVTETYVTPTDTYPYYTTRTVRRVRRKDQ
jgi:hypothetical protein